MWPDAPRRPSTNVPFPPYSFLKFSRRVKLHSMHTPQPSPLAPLSQAQSTQVEMRLLSLEGLLPQDHLARTVWSLVETLDLEPLYAKILPTKGTVGRNSIAPEILVSLWLLATLEGISSARELDRRCRADIAYLWILGKVTVNYHSLSESGKRKVPGLGSKETLVAKRRKSTPCATTSCGWTRHGASTSCCVSSGQLRSGPMKTPSTRDDLSRRRA